MNARLERDVREAAIRGLQHTDERDDVFPPAPRWWTLAGFWTMAGLGLLAAWVVVIWTFWALASGAWRVVGRLAI